MWAEDMQASSQLSWLGTCSGQQLGPVAVPTCHGHTAPLNCRVSNMGPPDPMHTACIQEHPLQGLTTGECGGNEGARGAAPMRLQANKNYLRSDSPQHSRQRAQPGTSSMRCQC